MRGKPPLTEAELATRCICGLGIDEDGHKARCKVGQWRRREGLAPVRRAVGAAELGALLADARRALAAGWRPS